jgi:hypothetical protein
MKYFSAGLVRRWRLVTPFERSGIYEYRLAFDIININYISKNHTKITATCGKSKR